MYVQLLRVVHLCASQRSNEYVEMQFSLIVLKGEKRKCTENPVFNNMKIAVEVTSQHCFLLYALVDSPTNKHTHYTINLIGCIFKRLFFVMYVVHLGIYVL